MSESLSLVLDIARADDGGDGDDDGQRQWKRRTTIRTGSRCSCEAILANAGLYRLVLLIAKRMDWSSARIGEAWIVASTHIRGRYTYTLVRENARER